MQAPVPCTGRAGGVCPRTAGGVGVRAACFGAAATFSTGLTGGVAERTTGGVADRTMDLLTTLRTANPELLMDVSPISKVHP